VPGSVRKPGPEPLIDRHAYHDEILEFLAAGWSAPTLNAMLGRLHHDYTPVPVRTLYRYKARLNPKVRRPLEEYQSRLRDDHVLIDTIRERAALILVQQAQV